MVGVDSLLSGMEGEEIDLAEVRNRGVRAQGNMDRMGINAPTTGDPNSSPNEDVSPQIMDIVMRPPEDMSDQTKLNALKSLPKITPNERAYVHRNTQDVNTIAWLNELAAQDVS